MPSCRTWQEGYVLVYSIPKFLFGCVSGNAIYSQTVCCLESLDRLQRCLTEIAVRLQVPTTGENQIFLKANDVY